MSVVHSISTSSNNTLSETKQALRHIISIVVHEYLNIDLVLILYSAVNGSCSRCQCVFTLVYHPTLVHASSPTLGYMDMVE